MIRVDIITPEKRAVSMEVDSVVVPGFDGEIGILAGHAPMVARLGAGDLRLKTGDEVQHLSVSGGFLEVNRGGVSVFAETAELAHEVDLERAQKAAENAKTRLKARDLTAAEMAEVEASLVRAVARLKVGRFRRRPGAPQA